MGFRQSNGFLLRWLRRSARWKLPRISSAVAQHGQGGRPEGDPRPRTGRASNAGGRDRYMIATPDQSDEPASSHQHVIRSADMLDSPIPYGPSLTRSSPARRICKRCNPSQQPSRGDGRVKPYQIHTSKNRTSFQLVAGICFRSGIVQASPPNTSNGSKFDSNTTLWAARSDLRIRLRNKMCASGRA